MFPSILIEGNINCSSLIVLSYKYHFSTDSANLSYKTIKFQITSTKLQININIQYSMTKTLMADFRVVLQN